MHYIVWLMDGSDIAIYAKSEREAIQTVCRGYHISHEDIDCVEVMEEEEEYQEE